MAHQVYYSLLNRDYEWELMQLGRDQGVGALIWSPLGWGKLTGKIRRGQPAKPGMRAHDIAGTGPRFTRRSGYSASSTRWTWWPRKSVNPSRKWR